jgi:hypothetical protein
MLQRSDAAEMRRFCDAQENGRRTKKDIWRATSGTLSQRQMDRHPVTFSELLCFADASLNRQQIAADVFARKQRRVSSRPADRHADINRTPGRRSSGAAARIDAAASPSIVTKYQAVLAGVPSFACRHTQIGPVTPSFRRSGPPHRVLRAESG